MRTLSVEEQVRMLAVHPVDDQGRPTIAPDDAVAITRWHLEIEEIEVADTDVEIWQLWKAEAAAASSDDINASVLERALERIKTGE